MRIWVGTASGSERGCSRDLAVVINECGDGARPRARRQGLIAVTSAAGTANLSGVRMLREAIKAANI